MRRSGGQLLLILGLRELIWQRLKGWKPLLRRMKCSRHCGVLGGIRHQAQMDFQWPFGIFVGISRRMRL